MKIFTPSVNHFNFATSERGGLEESDGIIFLFFSDNYILLLKMDKSLPEVTSTKSSNHAPFCLTPPE